MNTKARIASLCKIPILDSEITGVESFRLSDLEIESDLRFDLPKNLRLGHLVEKTVAQCIQASSNYRLLYESIQLIEEKQTIGEIDFILEELISKRIIHLELAYKFYLYDPSISDYPVQNWIGPNRNDSLHLKLKKLKEKQFPLLHHKVLESQLGGLAGSEISQALCFMASLFLPYRNKIELEPAYQKAVKGYYLSSSDFQKLNHSDSAYYLPPKKEWGMDPTENQNWLNYEEIEIDLNESIRDRRSRMCWKKEGDNYRTFFVVWW
jgi:hypothetical protein